MIGHLCMYFTYGPASSALRDRGREFGTVTWEIGLLRMRRSEESCTRTPRQTPNDAIMSSRGGRQLGPSLRGAPYVRRLTPSVYSLQNYWGLASTFNRATKSLRSSTELPYFLGPNSNILN